MPPFIQEKMLLRRLVLYRNDLYCEAAAVLLKRLREPDRVVKARLHGFGLPQR
jgi:hypothetical protein